jgi:hypothetical protein
MESSRAEPAACSSRLGQLVCCLSSSAPSRRSSGTGLFLPRYARRRSTSALVSSRIVRTPSTTRSSGGPLASGGPAGKGTGPIRTTASGLRLATQRLPAPAPPCESAGAAAPSRSSLAMPAAVTLTHQEQPLRRRAARCWGCPPGPRCALLRVRPDAGSREHQAEDAVPAWSPESIPVAVVVAVAVTAAGPRRSSGEMPKANVGG